jgi:hypothetical protein
MQVDVSVMVDAVHAFGPAGNDSGPFTLYIHSYHPTRGLRPRVELACPDGSKLVFDADELVESIQHASVKL